MKNKLIVLAFLLLLCLTLFSCGGEKQPPAGSTAPDTTPAGTTTGTPAVYLSGATGWTIVTPRAAETQAKDFAALFTEAGAAAPAVSVSGETPAGTREILFGNVTDRPESKAATGLIGNATEEIAVVAVTYNGERMAVCSSATALLRKVGRYLADTMMAPEGLRVTESFETVYYIDLYASITGDDLVILDEAALRDDVSLRSLSSRLGTLDSTAQTQTIELDYGTAAPAVAAEVYSPFSSVKIEEKSDGTAALVTVTAESGRTAVYEVAMKWKETYTPAVSVLKIKNGCRGAVTFVHDDSNRNTAEFLRGALSARNLRATIGVVLSFIGYNPETGEMDKESLAYWQSLLDTGLFEFSCHSMRHKFWGLDDNGGEYDYYPNSSSVTQEHATLPPGRITEEVKTSAEVLRELFPSQKVIGWIDAGVGYTVIDGVSYQGNGSETLVRLVRENYLSLRTASSAVNDPATMNFYKIRCYMVTDGSDTALWKAHIDNAIQQNGWSIIGFHQIRETGSGQTTSQADVSALLDHAAALTATGELYCGTYDEMTLYAYEYRASVVSATGYRDRIEFSVNDGLDDTLYSEEVTVRIPLPADFASETAVVRDGAGGVTVETVRHDEDGTPYLLCNLLPDGEGYTVLFPEA